jgi:MHS family proline/betaine transporter-like MFS transporter
MFLIPFRGWISGRIGALVVMGAAALIYTLLIYPMFSVLVHAPGFMPLLTVVCVSAVLTAASFGPLPALLCSLFPPEVRTTAVSIGYNFAAAIFGGLAPFIGTWLVRVTGDLIAPTYYAILCGTISVVAILLYAFNRKQIRFREVGPSHV